MVYIPKSMVAEVQMRIEAFKRYWEFGVELARTNLREFKDKKGR